MQPTRLVFCADEDEKISVCLKLGFTHYVDCGMPTMDALQDRIPFLYLIADEPVDVPSRLVRLLESWDDVAVAIGSDIESSEPGPGENRKVS